jgi:phospholipid/cholesterol/gamma-HCH transport system substrate-binding protein
MSEGHGGEWKVGLFVTIIMAMAAGTIFVLGGSSDLFETRYTLNASWGDVGGLKEGAVVRLAGWDVGEVSSIQFSDDLGVKEIFVELTVMTRYQERIRKDSEARIDTVGLLGDKYVAITMGDPSTPVLEGGAWIATRAPLDLVGYTKTATEILESGQSISRKVDLMLGSDQDAAQASLANSFQHIEEMLSAAKTGDGMLNALVYDPVLATRTRNIVGNLEVMSSNLRNVTEELQHGDGIANELVYGDDGAALAHELRSLATTLNQLSQDLKSEESLVHSLLYDPEKKQMIDDLAVTAQRLRETSEAISQGDGTIGMLARDPALYEDMRALVGGAQRNKLLRAYIRRTVEKGEETDATPWTPVE